MSCSSGTLRKSIGPSPTAASGVVKTVRTQQKKRIRVGLNDDGRRRPQKEMVVEQSTNFYASNLELGTIPPVFVHQLGRSRWVIAPRTPLHFPRQKAPPRPSRMSFSSRKTSRRWRARPMPAKSTNYPLSVNGFAKIAGTLPRHVERELSWIQFCDIVRLSPLYPF
jgi:hypothetical protein